MSYRSSCLIICNAFALPSRPAVSNPGKFSFVTRYTQSLFHRPDISARVSAAQTKPPSRVHQRSGLNSAPYFIPRHFDHGLFLLYRLYQEYNLVIIECMHLVDDCESEGLRKTKLSSPHFQVSLSHTHDRRVFIQSSHASSALYCTVFLSSASVFVCQDNNTCPPALVMTRSPGCHP